MAKEKVKFDDAVEDTTEQSEPIVETVELPVSKTIVDVVISPQRIADKLGAGLLGYGHDNISLTKNDISICVNTVGKTEEDIIESFNRSGIY